MKTKALAIAFALAVAGPAHALDLVSGWDFSQLDSANSFPFLNPPPTAINTLDANYSDFDPTSGMGAESADFGTLYFNGMFGSFAGSDALPDLGSSPILFPNANIVDPDGQANMTAPPMGSAAAKTILLGEGATDANDKRLSVEADPSGGGLLDIVFSADLSTLAGTGSDWQLSFAGQTESGNSNVDVAFSTDGSSYDPLQTVQLTTAADQFIIDVVGLPAVQGFFRLSFDGDAEIAPAVDNVVIKANVTTVPEPGTVAMLMAGLAGLGIAGRRRA